MHKVFGEGTVTRIKDDHMWVAFANGEKMFLFPDAIKNGFLIRM